MTSLTQPTPQRPGRPQRLDAFAVASEPGNERLAITRVAASASSAGLSAGRLERLKTAVAEATMNAIEHGNGNHAEIPVDVEVLVRGDEFTVAISDQGGGQASGQGGGQAGGQAGGQGGGQTPDPAAEAEEPDLAKKLDGAQSPRGWGLFLIRNMVDAMEITTHGQRHTVWLTMRTGAPQGAEHDEQV